MGHSNSSLLVSGFSSEKVAPGEVFDAYHSYISPARLTDLAPSSGWSRNPKASARVWEFGQLRALHGSHNGLKLSRRGASATRSVPEMICIQRYITGQSAGVCGDRAYRLNPSVISIADSASSLKAESKGRVEFYSITMPYEVIGYDPSLPAQLGQFSINAPVGRLMDSAVGTVFEQLDRASPDESKQMASAFAGLLRGLVLGEHNTDVSHSVRICRDKVIRQYVSRNLRDPNLTVELVCRKLSTSRATLYRTFKSDGGFRRFVTTQRLTGAMEHLKHSKPRRGLIGDVAASWCFDDPSQFSKMFRRQFGTSASEIAQCSPSDRLRKTRDRANKNVVVH